jgi:hypothetical protein
LNRLLTAIAVLTLGAAACGELPAESNVVDLRVLGIRAEPAGFLIDRDNPGGTMDSAMDDMLRAQLTALVVDPSGAMMELQVTNAVGCPDYIDTITSASQQMSASGAKICPEPGAPTPLPPDLAMLLETTPIVTPDMPQPAQPVDSQGLQWEPTVSYGLTSVQIAAFFDPDFAKLPEPVSTSIEYNRNLGLPGIVNLTFGVNGETVTAIKNVVYWPRLDYPGEHPNQNPTLGDPADPSKPKIRFYAHRDDTTGNPDQPYDDATPPTISISAGDKLYVEPQYDKDTAAESYQILVHNNDTDGYDPRVVEHELLRFYFYTDRGKFDPEIQYSEVNPVLSSGTLHTDAEWLPPERPENQPPADGAVVTIWIVTHDERAGTDWTSRTILLKP